MDEERSPLNSNNPKSWKDLIATQVNLNKLSDPKSRICVEKKIVDETKVCSDGRLPSRQTTDVHSETDDSDSQLTTYGELTHGARFIRCSMEVQNTIETLYHLVKDDVGEVNKPKLLVCCYGGAEYFVMSDNLEKEFRNGIAQVATTKNVWVLTTGLNKGVSNVVGRSLYRHRLLYKEASKPVVIGLNSWSTVSESTREELIERSKDTESTLFDEIGKNFTTMLVETEGRTLDKYHTHFCLIDANNPNHELSDQPRAKLAKIICDKSECNAITIIVEGGYNTLEVILNDLAHKRPVIIIHGSGRLASVLGELLERERNSIDRTLSKDRRSNALGKSEIKKYLDENKYLSFASSKMKHDIREIIDDIFEILKPEHNDYLKLFYLDGDDTVTDTIFRAVLQINAGDETKWEGLLKLAVTWDCIQGAHDILKQIKDKEKYYQDLFEQALKEDRPIFIDYFLRRYYNPLQNIKFLKPPDLNRNDRLTTNTGKSASSRRTTASQSEINTETYRLNRINSVNEVTEMADTSMRYHPESVGVLLCKNTPFNPTKVEDISPRNSLNLSIPVTLDQLERHYVKLIGVYAVSFYSKRGTCERFWKAVGLSGWNGGSNVSRIDETQNNVVLDKKLYVAEKRSEKQELLRDLFLWSVFLCRADMAFVFLLQIKSRICAALLATAMAQRLSLLTINLDVRHAYEEQAKAYEKYASDCIIHCYSFNELLACQLVLREIPLFGNITCIQIAISSNIQSFINTDVFNHVLNRQWHATLHESCTESLWSKMTFNLSLFSFGLLAPILVEYNEPSDEDNDYERQCAESIRKLSSDTFDRRARWKGICDKPLRRKTYAGKTKAFYYSPIVKMFYDFLMYIWFILVFSYMMMFRMRSNTDPIHWTEIYVVITITAMLVEEIRQLVVDYHTQMMEQWHLKHVSMVIIHATLYILFYIGFFLQMGSQNRPDLFTAARIVLAIDLELWFLFSLRFASAIKFLGPKLIMIKNMIRYLSAFVYLIFICIAAYGVVSRALFMRDQLEFTAANLFGSIFYRPYWFLYSLVDDEKNDLTRIISSNTSTTDQVIEATAAHVLLTFHILFINILLLNLLIAVFNFSFEKDQHKNEYYWRCQRYALIKEYFEKPLFAYPPLSLLVYIWLFIKIYFLRGTTCRVFKRFATVDLDNYWSDFENEATYTYARDLVEKKCRYHAKIKESKRSKETSSDEPTEIQCNVTQHGIQGKRTITRKNTITGAGYEINLSPTSN